MKKTIAVLGYGALSHIFLEVCRSKLREHYTLCGILTRTVPEDTQGLTFYPDLDALLDAEPDYVVELAGGEAVRQYGERILRRGCRLILVSIGALADDALYAALRLAAQESGSRLYLASGAVGGFDALRTLALAGTDSITIANRKPPAGLNGAPYLAGIPLPEDRETTVFSGTAREAIRAFPKNVNVAVAAALAAADPDSARVTIESVPGLTGNSHTISAENSLASVTMEFISRPDPANPRSSSITAWSAAALLKELAEPVVFF